MITDEELAGLPSDPELAFVRLENILRRKVDEIDRKAHHDDFDPDPFRLEYMTHVLAAARQFQIEALAGMELPRVGNSGIRSEYHQFRSDVDFVTMQIRIASIQIDRAGSVQLEPSMKQKLHHYIQQIRDLIELAELAPEKKDDLLSKLNKFAAEVDRTRTRFQAGMEFYVAVCAGINEGFKKLKPVKDMFDSIGNVLGRSKELEDHYNKQLPAPRERKRLEPPKKRSPCPEKRSAEIDDDIPF